MATIQDVEAKVGEVKDAEDAVITLLDQVHAMLVDAKTDPAKLDAVIKQLADRKDALAAAVVRNTDAA